MFYPQLSYGEIKPAHIPTPKDSAGVVDLLKKGGYADIYKGPLEIKLEMPSEKAPKRYCKPKGFSDQGWRED